MKRKARLVLFGLTISCAAAQPFQPHLWKISSAGNAVYLFGSIHAGTPDMYPLPKPVEDQFASSRVLLVEAYTAPGDPPPGDDNEDFVRDKGTYPDGDTLWKHLSRRTRRRVEEAARRDDVRKTFQEMNVDLDDLAHFRPWLVAVLFELSPAVSNGLQPELGIDDHFTKEAEHVGKPIEAIETVEFQKRLVSGFPDKLQVKWLEGTLGMRKHVPEVENAIISVRNVHMADAVERLLKNGGQAFIVVGGAHVPGILNLLKKRGYPAEEVPLPPGNGKGRPDRASTPAGPRQRFQAFSGNSH